MKHDAQDNVELLLYSHGPRWGICELVALEFVLLANRKKSRSKLNPTGVYFNFCIHILRYVRK